MVSVLGIMENENLKKPISYRSYKKQKFHYIVSYHSGLTMMLFQVSTQDLKTEQDSLVSNYGDKESVGT